MFQLHFRNGRGSSLTPSTLSIRKYDCQRLKRLFQNLQYRKTDNIGGFDRDQRFRVGGTDEASKSLVLNFGSPGGFACRRRRVFCLFSFEHLETVKWVVFVS